MKTDYHIHTSFSDDSREKIEDQVLRAIACGLQEICFTDHVDYGIKKDWSEGNIEYRAGDGMNYQTDDPDPLANVDYPAYFAEIERLQKKYAGQIVIKKGLEFGIQTITVDRYEKLWKQYGSQLDYTLLSVHQVDNKELWNQDFQRQYSWSEYNERYYREILECMKMFDHYCVLAHLDHIIRYDLNGTYPFEKLRDLIVEILKLAIAQGKGIELNTSSWHYGLADTTPSREILKLYRDLGGRIITVGSDGHSVRWLGDHVSEAVEILKQLGFSEICTFERMKPIYHKIF